MSSPGPYLRQPFKPMHARRLTFNDDYPLQQENRRDDPTSRTLFPATDMAAITPLGKNSPWVKRPYHHAH